MYTTDVEALTQSHADFERDGYLLSRGLVGREFYDEARGDLLALAERLTGEAHRDIDTAWNHFKAFDRRLGSLLYNAAKLLPSVHRIASSEAVLGGLRALGMRAPAIVDVNFRVDSCGEEKFLFGWHQDFWFSICSPAAVVAWIPLTAVRGDENGGVEIVPRSATCGRILRTRAGERYSSYADAVVLDEAVPEGPKVSVDMDAGDVLFFRFDVLHRSLPVRTPDRSRWTLQVRYADLYDERFRQEQFKPGVVTAAGSAYVERMK